MPPKRRTTIGQVNVKAKKIKQARREETEAQREQRLQEKRNRAATSRAAETTEQREARLQDMRARATTSRATETTAQRGLRQRDLRTRATTSRASETTEQREERLEDLRARATTSRAAETTEQREERLEDLRARATTSRAAETTEQREERLQDQRARATTSRAVETIEQREERLQDQRARATTSRDAETTEQREERLQHQRARATTSRDAETTEQREERLQEQRARSATSRAAETTEEREDRLQPMTDARRTSRTAAFNNLIKEGFNYDPTKNYAEYPTVRIGKMDKTCRFCKAKKFPNEPPGLCCANGKVKLPPIESPPETLLSYMTGQSSISKHFLKNIRRYNSCFQMTSFGATTIVKQPGFPTTFTIQGQVYHKAGSLLPLPDQSAKFLQLYFTGDEELEVQQRCDIIPGVRREIVLDLQRMFHLHNDLIRSFKTSLERMPTDEYKVVIRADKRPVGEHERRFNAPQTNEVAVVMSVDECERRDIVLQRRSNTLQRIPETHRWYDALQYPIMIPRGDDGYHFAIQQVSPAGVPTNKKVSAMDYYAYRLMWRENEHNHLLNCRQLFHQYLVDMYAKIESERLLFIKLNQKKLRAEDYINLKDAMANDGNVQELGSLVILPATFTGSPRHMHEYTQDAMTYVRNYGRPDLFITFTCNPSWAEIKELLISDQAPNDRHDLIARVFRQKQIKLIDLITKGHIFGAPRCWMYTIEYQKRGLPHSHNLIWLKEKMHPTQIDSVISAEIPNREEDPELFEIITKNMIHSPCGYLNRKSPCMKEEKCSKRYPRQLITETQTGDDGYPQYRRRAPEHGGHTATIKLRGSVEMDIDNRWVVPYSPLLSKTFKAHINVEYCNSVKSIKYVCKYVNKGSDMAVFGLANERTHDEVAQYQLGRYVSSNEAAWRIFGFPIHDRYPTVQHLSVHLEDGQRVYFTADNAQRVAEHPPNTTLTAFFKLCQDDSFARTLLYPQVPKYYTWDASRKVFKKRKLGEPVPGYDAVASDALGRVYTVHPNNAECFFLRMLLHTVRGPTSFASLKTVNNEVCQTYREACRRLGLLEDDQHWDNTMAEAQLTSLPEQIRSLFSIILTCCNPSNPKSLWDKYKESMSEDFLATARRENADLEFSAMIFNEALIALENKCMAIAGKTLCQLGVPSPERGHHDILYSEITREKNYNLSRLRTYVETNRPLLNEDQHTAYERIMQLISTQQGGIVFLDAPGGTGKTFLVNLILAEVRTEGNVALALASSGIAATLMDGGRTAHSALKLPLDISRQQTPTCNISKASGQAQVLRECKVIVWDECTMAHKKSLEALNVTLKDLRCNSNLMGGTLVLLCGDFRQTLPVIPKSTPADEINACLKHSTLWTYVETLKLKKNMRLIQCEGTAAFAEELLKIGNGTLKEDSSGLIKFPPDFCHIHTTVDDLVMSVYPQIEINYADKEWLCKRAILAAKNEDVCNINNDIIEKIPGAVHEYVSVDTVAEADDAVNYPPEFLNSLNPPGLPEHRIKLKVGCPVILLRNLDPPRLCNGTRLWVSKMLPNVVEAIVLTGIGKGESVFIPRIPLIPTDLPFSFKRLQLPLRLAFSMTINKSQGQSIETCGIDLRRPCFSHGQLYVAVSRVCSPNNLYILAPDAETKNIVYQQVLR